MKPSSIWPVELSGWIGTGANIKATGSKCHFCTRSYGDRATFSATDEPFLMSIQLRKSGCSLAAYLPADAFWALPAMISSGAITHIEARFDRLLYGSGDLQSLYLANASKLAKLG